MTLMIELPTEIQRRYESAARSHGLGVEAYLQEILLTVAPEPDRITAFLASVPFDDEDETEDGRSRPLRAWPTPVRSSGVRRGACARTGPVIWAVEWTHAAARPNEFER